MKHILRNFKLKRRAITMLAGMHFFGHPSKKLKVIGVTGTNGKTTVATLLYKTALALGYRVGLISTVENLIMGEKMSAAYNAPSTTPDPIFLNSLLNEMVKKGCEYVFMEVTSHALDQNRVAGIRFAGGIFTNLTQDHLDYHGSMEKYFGAKKKFFKMLPRQAFALGNTDDEYGERMLEKIRARKFRYGFKGGPVRPHDSSGAGGEDFHGEIEKLDFSGLKLKFNGVEIKSKLIGKFNASNLLAVWGASSLLGFNMAKVSKILESIDPPRGRFEHFMSASGVLVIIDYAHTPDALEKVLLAIQEMKLKIALSTGAQSRVISLFGCAGDRDPLKRPIMGKIGARLSDIPILTSDNPRSEDPDKIVLEMQASLSPAELEKIKAIPDRREAIKEAVKIARSGDIILCAGKGHEDYQDIKGVKHHFSDMEEFRKAYGL